MAIGSGLGSQLGYVKESTWGTYVAPTKFLPVTSFQIDRTATKIQGEGIRTGVLTRLGATYSEAINGAKGSFSFEVPSNGILPLIQNLLANSPTPSGTTVKTFAFTGPADPNNFSLTVQGGVPQADGTVQRFNAVGAKLTSMEFACSVGQVLTASAEFDAKAFEQTSALATASFATGQGVFPWQMGSLKLGAFASETLVNGVRGFSFRVNRPLDTERYSLGSGASKLQQVPNGFVELSGSIEVDLLDSTLIGYVQNDTNNSLVVEFAGMIGGNAVSVKLNATSVRFQDFAVPVSGPQMVRQTLNWTGLYDGTNDPLKITVLTTDTTL